MPLFCTFVLMAQAAQSGSAEVPLRYRRPSVVVAQAKGLGATMIADDVRSRVSVSGTVAQVRDAREFLRLFDVPRRTLIVRVTVSSPIDHLDWTVDARLTNGQRWKTADEETGSEIALDPALSADGVLRVVVFARSGGVELGSTMRLAKGQERSLAFGKRIEQRIDVSRTGKASVTESGVPLPTVTVRYVGN